MGRAKETLEIGLGVRGQGFVADAILSNWARTSPPGSISLPAYRVALGKATRVLVIPVIDLLGGQVVRAMGGRRHEYQPWASPIAGYSSQFEKVLQGLCGIVSHRTAYVADLDAITAQERSFAFAEYLEILTRQSTSCLLDRGLGGAAELSAFLESLASTPGVIRPIFGSESLRCPEELPEMVSLCRAAQSRPALSLDLKAGRPVALAASWQQADPLEIVDCAGQAGISSLIVLDLADVGAEQGGSTHRLCEAIRHRHPEFELIAGGGVRSYDDCGRFADAGCDAVLVATALHSGRLTREHCDRLHRNS